MLDFERSTGWMESIKLLKEHENETNEKSHAKYFFPLTSYDKFIWNEQE